MAAIGKIRSWGPWLVGIIGLALFGFIATDFTKSCESHANAERQQVGEVMGEKLMITDWTAMLNEYKSIIQANTGQESGIDEDEVKDYVWQQYTIYSVISDEAQKLGLAVTDDEFKAFLTDGTSPIFMSLARQFGGFGYINQRYQIRLSFIDQQTGRFDYNQVSQMYNSLKKANEQQPQEYGELFREFENYWNAAEKMLRQQLLIYKYHTLLQACYLSNPISAKEAYRANTVQSRIALASLAYSDISDNTVSVSDADMKAKYEEKKEMFKWINETRDIKYVVCEVEASEADVDNLKKELTEAGKQFAHVKADSLTVEDIVSTSHSTVNYLGLGYTQEGLNNIVAGLAARVDSMNVGDTSEPFAVDDDMYLVSVIKKYEANDSIQYQSISVATKASADSIVNLLNSGTPFDSVTFYGQAATKAWLESAQYQNATSIGYDDKAFIRAITSAPRGELKVMPIGSNYLVYKVLDTRNQVKKYDVAVIKRPIEFSNDTYNEAYKRFNDFISESPTTDALVKNAEKYGYTVRDQENITKGTHRVGGYLYGKNGQVVTDPKTRRPLYELPNTIEAIRWAFDEAQETNVSKLYDRFGDGKRLLVVTMTKVHPEGYLDWESAKDYLKNEVLRDKKFQILSKKLGNSIEAARQQGAAVDTISGIMFGHATINGIPERRLSGAVSAVAVGQTSKHVVKGENGAYLFQVIDRTPESNDDLDMKAIVRRCIQQNRSYSNFVLNELYERANVVDNRYKF